MLPILGLSDSRDFTVHDGRAVNICTTEDICSQYTSKFLNGATYLRHGGNSWMSCDDSGYVLSYLGSLLALSVTTSRVSFLPLSFPNWRSFYPDA